MDDATPLLVQVPVAVTPLQLTEAVGATYERLMHRIRDARMSNESGQIAALVADLDALAKIVPTKADAPRTEVRPAPTLEQQVLEQRDAQAAHGVRERQAMVRGYVS